MQLSIGAQVRMRNKYILGGAKVYDASMHHHNYHSVQTLLCPQQSENGGLAEVR